MTANYRPDLLTVGLRLRPWGAGDLAAFHRIWGDPHVIWWGADADLAASQQRLTRVLAKAAAMPAGLGWWAVEAQTTGELLGNVILQRAPYETTVELGYHFLQSAQGQGHATRAAARVLRYGFADLQLPEISGVVHVDNAPSHRVMARLGLRDTGALRYRDLPHRRYAMLADDAPQQPWWAANQA